MDSKEFSGSSSEQSIPVFPAQALETFVQRGFTHALLQLYSTSLDDFTATRIIGVSALFDPNLLVHAINFTKAISPVTIISAHQFSGNWTYGDTDTCATINGGYLAISIPVKPDEEPRAAYETIERFRGALRVFFGPYIARELHWEAIYCLSEPNIKQKSQAMYFDPLPSPEIVDLQNSLGSAPIDFHAHPRALELVAQAHETPNRTLKFILIWTAIEVQIGDGKARKDFCIQILNSNRINSRLEEIRSLRNEYLKEGKEFVFSSFDEYSMVSILKLSFMSNEIHRHRATVEFEARINSPETFPGGEFYRLDRWLGEKEK